MPTPTASVKVNPITGALIDPIAATFASANGFLTGGTSDAKESVVCATTANGTLATAFENGDTVDGIVLATGNRILIKNQSAPAENGIYTVNASGAPTRATDFDSWTEIVGAFVSVESGTVNAGTQWLCNVVSGGTLNTTAITFVVPKNFVDLTTNQTVGGNKNFSAGSTIGGVQISKDTVDSAVNGSIQFLEDDSILAISANAGSLWLHTVGNTDVTLPLSGTLLSTADLGANVGTFLATPSSANLAAAVTDETGSGALVFGTSPLFKTTINLNNPANTFKYVITPAAIVADRILNMPLITATDTLATLGLAQTFSNTQTFTVAPVFTNQSASLSAIGEISVYKTSDTSRTNTTTFADDDQLTMTVGVGVWAIEILTIFANVSTTSYAKISPAYTGTADYALGVIMYMGNAAGLFTKNVPNGSDSSIFGTSTFMISTQYGGHLCKFTMRSTASGTLSLQWAQGVPDAVNATVLKKGSYIKCTKISES